MERKAITLRERSGILMGVISIGSENKRFIDSYGSLIVLAMLLKADVERGDGCRLGRGLLMPTLSRNRVRHGILVVLDNADV